MTVQELIDKLQEKISKQEIDPNQEILSQELIGEMDCNYIRDIVTGWVNEGILIDQSEYDDLDEKEQENFEYCVIIR